MSNEEIYRLMVLSRAFEEKIKSMDIHGTYHLSIGQEASHVGLCAALEKGDWIVPSHRCHGFTLAKGADISKMFSEMLGSRHGLSKGLGGSMHMSDPDHHNLGASAVVGSSVCLAGGIALWAKMTGENNIAVAIFGDAASSRGTLHEMMNISSVLRLPILFFMENNHYGMSECADEMISTKDIYKRSLGYSMESEKTDGNSVSDVIESVKRARKYILENKKPYFIEVDTYRQCGHSKSDPVVYRTREEEYEWKKKDPIKTFSKYVENPASIEKKAEEEIEKAYRDAVSTSSDILSFEEMKSFVSEKLPVFKNEGRVHSGTYREALTEAIEEILKGNEKAFIMGEDIGLYGGAFGVTAGLKDKFPDRVIETPVAEEAFTGMAVGAAALGMAPIVEVMYSDFVTLASDAIINHAAKLMFMSGGSFRVPMILRTPIGGGTGHGPQHSQSLETMFLNVPGLTIVAPSDPYSAKALLKSAAEYKSPVLFFEHKCLYDSEGEIGDEDTFLPLGRAIVHGNGDELIVIGYSHAFSLAVDSLSDLRDRITFIDLATIKPIDEKTLTENFKRVGKALIVQGTGTEGSVGEIVYRILGGGPGVRIVSSENIPIPASEELEKKVLNDGVRIREEALKILSSPHT